MTKSLAHPDLVRRLNLFGPAVGDPALIVALDADELLGVARDATGLSDVGELEWPGWEDTYRRLLGAIDAESNLSLIGRVVTRGEVLRVLETWLRLVDEWRRTPAVAAQAVDDVRLAARASVLRVSVDTFSGAGAGGSSAIEAADAATPALLAARDDGGLARAWRLRMMVPLLTGKLSDLMARRAAEAAGAARVTEAFRAIGLQQAMFIIPLLSLLLAVVLYCGSRTIVACRHWDG